MSGYDCMTPDELALWRRADAILSKRADQPCFDCPAWFAAAAKAEGCCGFGPKATGRPGRPVSEERREQMRRAASRYRARQKRRDRTRVWKATLRGEVEVIRSSRARARGYNTVVGVSDVSATMRDGAAFGAYSTEGRAVAFPPGVRR